jgi:hypothetical protein
VLTWQQPATGVNPARVPVSGRIRDAAVVRAAAAPRTPLHPGVLPHRGPVVLWRTPFNPAGIPTSGQQ